jgi:DNA-binding transcriptional regulator YiaG
MDRLASQLFTQDSKSGARSEEFVWSFAERQLLQAQQREAEKQLQLKAQSSTLHTPSHRVSIWENVHGLRLPTDPAHPILKVIAERTGLSLTQVLEVQTGRRPVVEPIATSTDATSLPGLPR